MKKIAILFLLPLLAACQGSPASVSSSEPIPNPDPKDKFPSNEVTVIKDDSVTVTLTPSLKAYQANSQVSFSVALEDSTKEITAVLIGDYEYDWADRYEFVMPFAPVTITVKTNTKKEIDTTLPSADYYTEITDTASFRDESYGRPKMISRDRSKSFYLSDRDYPVYARDDTSKPLHRFYPGDKLRLYKKDGKISFALLTRYRPVEGKIEKIEDDSGIRYTFRSDDKSIDTSQALTCFSYGTRLYDFSDSFSAFKEKLLKGPVYGYYSDVKTDEGTYKLFGVGIE